MAATHRMPQSWLNPKLKVRPSAIHGRGVFARAAVRKGERLAIFGGEVMSIDEIDDLPESMQEYPMQIEERFVLGSRSARRAEATDLVNHSCAPNAGFRGQIFLVAMRTIRAGEEITFDYGMVVSPSADSDIVFEMKCRCQQRDCRRVITETDWRRPELQRRYGGYFSQYLQERIDTLVRRRRRRAARIRRPI
jgi:SET domain-containing protein